VSKKHDKKSKPKPLTLEDVFIAIEEVQATVDAQAAQGDVPLAVLQRRWAVDVVVTMQPPQMPFSTEQMVGYADRLLDYVNNGTTSEKVQVGIVPEAFERLTGSDDREDMQPALRH
jgi:hypothetical protein